MKEKIKLPVFVYEVETGDIELYTKIDELRAKVEEFWDILEEDFKFWDKDGYPMHFEKSFLDRKENSIEINEKREEQLLKSYLIEFGDKNGVNLMKCDDMDLVNIFNYIVNQTKRRQ